jgi:flagellar basal body rod protein FlgG
MSSGVYAAISASIARMQSLEVTTNNLANANTHGFKRDRHEFEALFQDATQDLAGKGINLVRIQKNVTDFTPSDSVATDNPLDLAIEGEGFFKLQGNGRLYYSRRGSFERSAEGHLVNALGGKVVDEKNQPVVVPEPLTLTIDERGNMFGSEGEAGAIPLFTVDDLTRLRKEGDGSFTLAPGGQERRVEQPRILQKRLESSNVQPLQEMARMIEGLRAFEACQKVIKTYGSLNSKADEIGSVG